MKLHIPAFVKNEFITHRTSELLKPFRMAEKDLWDALRRELAHADKEALKNYKESINNICKRFEQSIIDEFVEWANDVKAEFHEMKLQHAPQVFEAYFKGAPPFKNPKNRDDIPDAFIYLTIKDIVDSNEELSVIIEDGALSNACKNVPNIAVYRSLKDFIRSDSIKVLITDNFEKFYFEMIIESLSQNTQILEDEILNYAENALLDYTIHTEPYDYTMPDPTIEATITGFLGDPTDIDFDFFEAEYYGDGQIVIPFSFDIDVLADRTYGRREEEFSLEVKGNISARFEPFEFEKLKDDSSIEELLNTAELQIDSIEDYKIKEQANNN